MLMAILWSGLVLLSQEVKRCLWGWLSQYSNPGSVVPGYVWHWYIQFYFKALARKQIVTGSHDQNYKYSETYITTWHCCDIQISKWSLDSFHWARYRPIYGLQRHINSPKYTTGLCTVSWTTYWSKTNMRLK